MAWKRGKRWVAVAYDPKKKRTKRLPGSYATQREAKDAEAAYRTRPTATNRETCDSFVERWVSDYPRPRASTNLHNAQQIKRFAGDFRNVRLADIDKPTARQWAMKHRSSLGAVRAMFGDAVRDGLIPMNPFAELRLPGSKGRKEIQVLSEPELLSLAALALDLGLGDYGECYEAMILFAGYTGVRPGELFALQRDDIYVQDGIHLCNVERSLSKAGTVGPTKNGKPRTIIVPPIAFDRLGNLPIHSLLFESPSGKMWRQSSHHHYWARLRTKAGREDLDFYSLRHTAATLLIERGASPWEVAVQLGHTDGGQLVSNLYGHPRDQVARARMAALWDTTPIRRTG